MSLPRKIQTSFEQFIRLESLGGILLISCAALAMILANSPLAHEYFELWEIMAGISWGSFGLEKSIHFWINDGLMAIFFFVVGLEIKRELIAGELSTPRSAALPIFAAIGGMVLPALLFVLLHGDQPGKEAWGVPMATDIAFALGILMLLRDKVSVALKIFLTALAIVDDIGAVLVIALFYTEGIQWAYLGYAGILFAVLVILNLSRSNRIILYLAIGGVIWYFFLKSGIHPTVAGVLVALTIPARQRLDTEEFLSNISHYLPNFWKADKNSMMLAKQQYEVLDELESDIKRIQPPLQRMEHYLHPYVAFAIMPIFALANAGISLQPGGGGDLPIGALTWSIAVGLLIGKISGITVFSWLAVRLGVADLPEGVGWRQILGASFLGGIGFTMALFIANLGLPDEELVNQAKMGIIIASVVAAVSGYYILRIVPKVEDEVEPVL